MICAVYCLKDPWEGVLQVSESQRSRSRHTFFAVYERLEAFTGLNSIEVLHHYIYQIKKYTRNIVSHAILLFP